MTDPHLTVRLDRRAEILDTLLDELRELEKTVVGLTADLTSREAYESARDEGKFRDFVPVADLYHRSEEVLEWVAEELIDQFGWLVDVGR